MDNRARDDEQGQVSEVSGLDAGGPRSPSDAVAGHPTDREVQEGATGPDARTGDQDDEHDQHDDQVEQGEGR